MWDIEIIIIDVVMIYSKIMLLYKLYSYTNRLVLGRDQDYWHRTISVWTAILTHQATHNIMSIPFSKRLILPESQSNDMISIWW